LKTGSSDTAKAPTPPMSAPGGLTRRFWGNASANGIPCFLSHLSGKRRSKYAHRPEARRRRYSPFPPAYRRACPFKGGLPAAVLPPAQLRTPMFAQHSRRSSLKTELRGVLKGVNFGAHARQDRLEILSHRRSNLPSPYANWSIADPAGGVRRKDTEPELEFGRPEFGPLWANSHRALTHQRSSCV